MVYLRNKRNFTRVASHIRKCTICHYHHDLAAPINVRDFLRTMNRPIYTLRENYYDRAIKERLTNNYDYEYLY